MSRKKWWVWISVTATMLAAPRFVCGRAAGDFYAGDANLQRELSRSQQRWVGAQLSRNDFKTGHSLFDAEWWFGTYVMSALGFGQIALEHPELAAEQLPWLERSLERLVSEELRAFDTQSWSEDALAPGGPDRGHAAYLGYMNLALSLHRRLKPESRWAALNDSITATLRRRFEASPSGLIETYPNETYPVDNLAGIGSIALHARATGSSADAFLERWCARLREQQIDPRTGLLIQAASAVTGRGLDSPRGSGSALGAYFVSFADPELARDLHRAVRRELTSAPLGLGMVREYPNSVGLRGRGDIDSGPLLFGYSVSATGFSLGSARAAGDSQHFASIFRTADLFGALRRDDQSRGFTTGGPLGNAIMLAMLTAPKGAER
jgi:hypothetical protein